jgi:chemotaxis signal transduction protein
VNQPGANNGAQSAHDLRQAFDAGFAALPAQRGDDIAQFLSLRIAGSAYAVALSEIEGFSAAGLIVGFPSALPELLGLAGLRGELLPVYSLEALLAGQVPGPAARWFFRSKGKDPVAFGFADFERHLDVPRAEILAANQGGQRAQHLGAFVRQAGAVLAVIDVASLVHRIRERVAELESSKER